MKLCVLFLVAVAALPVKRKYKHPEDKEIVCVMPFDGTRYGCAGYAATIYYFNTETKECRHGFRGCEPNTPLRGIDCYYACTKTKEFVRVP